MLKAAPSLHVIGMNLAKILRALPPHIYLNDCDDLLTDTLRAFIFVVCGHLLQGIGTLLLFCLPRSRGP